MMSTACQYAPIIVAVFSVKARQYVLRGWGSKRWIDLADGTFVRGEGVRWGSNNTDWFGKGNFCLNSGLRAGVIPKLFLQVAEDNEEAHGAPLLQLRTAVDDRLFFSMLHVHVSRHPNSRPCLWTNPPECSNTQPKSCMERKGWKQSEKGDRRQQP